jgi:ribosome-binding protein aMBF1 (putative translation factor)
MKRTAKCPICGAPYQIFDMTVADQSACPECVREGERRVTRPTDREREEQRRRRSRFFRS